MSRYRMHQRLFALGDDFTIRDDAGRDAFFVDGKVFSISNQLRFQDLSGNELAFIRQKLFSWGPTYEITRDGQVAAVVEKKLFTMFACRFRVDVPGPDDIEARGDFLDQEYAFTRGGRQIARISKQWFSISDSYGVEIAPGEDDILLLACAVVIDMACHADKE